MHPHQLTACLFCLLLLTRAARAQPAQPGRIDSLTTAAQVQRFVRAQTSDYTSYKEFIVTDSVSQECDSVLTCLVPGGHPNWLKADFDGNGQTDLLVTGYPHNNSPRRRITCFLHVGELQFKAVQLNYRVFDCAVFQAARVKNRAAIRYAHIVTDGHSEYESYGGVEIRPPVCRVDTLVFAGTGFIEYNHAPRDYRIQKIAFSTTQCLGRCPVFSLQINQQGTATYQAGKYSKPEGNFSATIQAAPLRELWDLLNYLNFPRLNDDYTIGATDHPTYNLTITYANGQVKRIEDYGGEGTFGLSRVYGLLFALRTSQPWK